MLLALALPASAAGSPYVHAHRGGSLQTSGGQQVPRFPENTIPAFEEAASSGFVLELDVKLTSEDVPVVIHDATLDRTTDCVGQVAQKAAAEIAACEVDILGTSGNSIPLPPGDPRRAPVPTLAHALELAHESGAVVNLEIKNIPTDPDFDATNGFAQAVAAAIKDSGFPPSRLIVQSFWPANLDVIEGDAYFEFAETSLLTLQALNAGAPAFADARGYEWVSPAWPIDPLSVTTAAFIADAHALGLRIVPYTLDGPAAVKAAAQAGVDAVITNDPEMARAAIKQVAPPAPQTPPPPSDAECEAARASRTLAPIEAFDPRPGAPRVFAMQFKQELRHVETYADFRTKIECMVREYVVPRKAKGRPNVVALNEDVGLMTLATGTRGAAARAIFADPDLAPSCEPQGIPCGVAGALAAVDAAYSPQIAAYAARFPEMQPVASVFVAGTDTFARGWMQVFSDVAKRYGVYILGSNNQPPFRQSVDPSEIPLFKDPDLPNPGSVFVATDERVYNEVFMWGPEDVREEGPPMLRNVVAQNKKVPLTPLEELIQLTNGPAGGPDGIENLRPYRVPGTRARVGFATSLPAFIYTGNTGADFGQPLDAGIDPCDDLIQYYMRCLDRLGANVVMQDEANGGGRWTGPSGEGNYTPLEWNRSTWRAAGDPSVGFAYNVTPFMVGNLADINFDGQTSITQRRLAGGRSCNYVGVSEFMPGPPENDPAHLEVFAGPKPEFLAIVPWVTADAPRDELRATAAKLAAGSGDALENDYVETAAVADLPFPRDRYRPGCVEAGESIAGRCATKRLGTAAADTLVGWRRGDRLRGRAGDDVLRAKRGGDCLGGGPGADLLKGGRGDDRLRGGPGADAVRCGRGRDGVQAGPRDRVGRSCERVVRPR